MHKHLRILLLMFLSMASYIGYGQTPVPMSSQTLTGGVYTYTENFSDVANWTSGFTAGTGASRFRTVATNSSGTIPDGLTITTASTTLSASTSTSTSIQKGSGTTAGQFLFLTTGTTDNSVAIAVDFLVDFTNVKDGTLSFKWAGIDNAATGTSNRTSSLRIYTSPDNGAHFTELPDADAIGVINGQHPTGSVSAVTLPAALNGQTGVVIRFYVYNGGAPAGTSGSRPKIAIDDLTVTAAPASGTPPPPSDTTPPVTTAGYPKTGNITATTVDLTSNLNEAGTTYYVVVPSAGATSPTAAQVKAGQDATGTAVTLSGSFAVGASADATTTISNLTASTGYNIYSVSQDAATTPNLQNTVVTSAVTTLAPTLANVSTYPKTANVATTSVDLLSDLNVNGNTYYVVQPTADAAPTAAQVLAGQNGSGATASIAGSFAVTANTAATKTITGLTPATGYKIYVASKNTAGTQQTTLSTLSITTTIQYFASYTFDGVVAPSGTSTPGTGLTDPTPVPTQPGITFGSFTVKGNTTTNPNASGRFSFTNWPVDPSAGNVTGVIDTTQYYTVTITPQPGHAVTLTSINFRVQRSATGIRQYAVRSNLDGFASNLSASLDPATASSPAMVNLPGNNIFQVIDPATSGTIDGSTIKLDNDNTFANITTPVIFHFYGFNAKANTGTFSIDNVNFVGSASIATPPADVTPPVNAAGYPKANNITNTTVALVSNLTETGTTYYVLLPASNTSAPSIAQIMAGTDGTGNAALKAGTINVPTANTDASATISGLTQATAYNIYTVSKDAAATPNVQTASVTTPLTTTGDTPKTDQHITLAATATATYGGGDVDPAATSDNPAIPITYTSSDLTVATIVANKVHIVKAGTVNITATQAGDATHDPATAQVQILTITPKAITVIAAAATKIYGDTDPAFTYTTSTALVGTDAFTGALTRAAGEAVNTYAITQGTLALNSNYTITYTGASLTITPKAITIIANAATKTYGDADPAFTYTTNAALVGTDAFTGVLARAAGESVGTYAITQGTLALSNNYTVTYTGANLTITPKVLTITADNQTKIYGAANPTLTITYSGFANGDTQASLTTPAIATTTANAASTIGTYDIIPAGAASNNYTFNYVNGKLTVVTNSRTLTFNSLPAKTYGNADFDPNATLSSGETPIYTTSDANVAIIVNGKIHIVGAGNVTITASAPANPDYGVTQPVSQFLIINKADQTINFASIPGLLSGATYSLSNVTSSSGLPVTFTVDDPFIASVQGTTLNALTIGSATVIASVSANANYNAASTSQQVKVTNVNGDELVVHQAVSPNGDGINDFLFIEGIQDHPVNKVTIVNGTGIKVFEVNNYSNTNSNLVFNGRSNVNGKQQVAGTYFYLIELNDGGKLNRKTGYFLLKY